MTDRFVADVNGTLVEIVQIARGEFALLKPTELVGIPYCFTMHGKNLAVWPSPLDKKVGLYRLVQQPYVDLQTFIGEQPVEDAP